MRSSTKRTSLQLLAILAIALCGCSQKSSSPFAVRGANIEHGVLAAQLDWRPSALVLDALDHGIALDFEVIVEAQGASRFGWHPKIEQVRWRRELRYFPLTRQYQMRDPDQDAAHDAETRSYSARALLIAAISDLRLQLPPSWSEPIAANAIERYVLRIDLLRDNLPGALRLPALIDPDWRLSTGNFTWPATPSAG